ncbi:MAG: hypothetical protein LUH40_05395, partial [Clostridiales bacterium]|nr:hypothetical protein [Clostridiales bacterium]
VVASGQELTYDNAVDYLEYYLDTRITWLSEQSALWSGEDYIFVTDTETYAGGKYDMAAFAAAVKEAFQKLLNFFMKIVSFLSNLFN